jgi:multidrug efflux pump subunit AcrA (membrane-fusion protein)
VSCAAAALLIFAWTACADGPTAATSPAGLTVSVTGTIEAFWSVDLNAKASGYVADVQADLGDHVKKGAPMAVLSVPELENTLAQTKANVAAKKQMLRASESVIAQSKQALAVAQKQLASDKVDLEYQQVTLKRQQELSAGSAITPQQLDEARSKAAMAAAGAGVGEARVAAAQADVEAAQANRDVAAAQVDVAQAAVDEAQTMLAYTHITAPFDGVVTRRMVNVGELVQGSATTRGMPLFTLQHVETVRVFCDVPELQAAGVAVGDRADVKVYGLDGQVITAKITRMATALNPTTRTMRAEIDLPNPTETLRPGMYVQVALTARPVRAPTTAATTTAAAAAAAAK